VFRLLEFGSINRWTRKLNARLEILKTRPFGVVSRASAPPGYSIEEGHQRFGVFRAIIVSFPAPFLDRSFMLQATRPCRAIRRSPGVLIELLRCSDLSLPQIMYTNQQSRNEMLSRMMLATQSLRQLSFTSGPEQVRCRLWYSVSVTEGVL